MVYAGLLLFFVLEYVRPGSYFPPLSLLYTIVPAGVILGTLLGKREAPADSPIESNTWIFGILLSLIVSSVIVADVTMYTFTIFTSVLGYVLVYWVITRQVTTLPRLKGLFLTLIAIHAVLALLTPAMFTNPGERHYIASGTFLGDGNDYALSVNIVIPFCLFLLADTRKAMQKLLYAGLLLFLILCVVLTQSRGGTLALGCVAVYYWLKSDRKLLTGGLAAAGLVLVLALAPDTYFNRMNTISSYETDGSAQGRLTAWQAGVGMALSNPLMGVGAGQFPPNFTKFAPVGPEGPEVRWKTAHSIYFLILGELGLPGIGLLFAFILVNLFQNRSLSTELHAQNGAGGTYRALLASLSASVIAYAVAGAFLSATYYPHMFVLGGLLVAARRQARTALARAGQPQDVTVHAAAAAATPRPRVAMVTPRRQLSGGQGQHGRFF